MKTLETVIQGTNAAFINKLSAEEIFEIADDVKKWLKEETVKNEEKIDGVLNVIDTIQNTETRIKLKSLLLPILHNSVSLEVVERK